MFRKLIYLFCFVLVLMIAAPVFGDDILAPGDFIIAIDADGGSDSPDNEQVPEAIDRIYGGANQKYLNFGGLNSGFIVTPASGPSIIDSFTIWTANDEEGRDPATWELYGTNDTIVSTMHSQGTGESWTLIESGSISLPAGRNSTDTGPGGYNATVPVTSTESYASYKMLFPTLKNAGTGMMQFAEVQFYGTFIIPYASLPNPYDGATNVSIETNLSWRRGDGTDSDKVYFGTASTPPYVTTIPATSPALYDPGDPNLIPSTTYYWQIVEVNDAVEYPGPIWSFTTIPGKTSVVYPADGAVIPGQPYGDNIYTWLDFKKGPTTVSYEGFFSDNYEDVLNREASVSLGAPPYPSYLKYYVGYPAIPPYTQSLVREMTYYWCVDGSDAFGRTFPGDIWQFSIQGYRAFWPDPLDGAMYVNTDVLLDWREGIRVGEHDVYLGTDWDDVNDAVYNYDSPPPEYVGSVTAPDSSLQVTGLKPETMYYWRVDEVYGRLPPPMGGGDYYKGPVWSFTTRAAIPGLVGEYFHWFDGITRAGGDPGPVDPFQSKVLVRIDPNINFDFDTNPAPGVNPDNFSIRWTGKIAVPHKGETYTFTTETDDGVRLWVNDQLIIDKWIDQGRTLWSGTIYLDTFGPYDIKMEYYENGGGAVARLMWASPSTAYGVIPSNYLAPTSDEAKAAWTAYGPYPRDRGLILPDEDLEFKPTLTWVPGLYSSTHELYFSTDFDDVNERTAPKIMVSDPYYTPGLLDMDQTYYWCVDESNSLGPAPGEWPGDVWSFTPVSSGYVTREWWTGFAGATIPDLTSHVGYPNEPDGSELVTTFEGPVDWMDNYGSRIHGWLRPRISGSYTFWLATDDGGALYLSTDEDPANVVEIASVSGWVGSRDWYNGSGQGGPNQRSNPISLDGRKKYYISALMKEAGGGDNIAVAWQGPAQPNPPVTGQAGAIIDGRFLSATTYDPPYATNPNPVNGATNVQDRTPELTWWPGCYVQAQNGHRVYFSSDFDDVNDRTVSPVIRSDPCYPITTMLDLGRTYYWTVDEVNPAKPPGLWPGRRVWSFTLSECLSIENVEDYNDRTELRKVWTDGKASVTWGGSYPYHHVVTGGSSGSNLNISTEVGTYWNGAPSSEPVSPPLPGAFNTQSLVLHYDNDGSTFTPYTYNPAEEKWVYPAPYYSEIERDVTSPNWTSEGLKSLVMWFVGHPLSDGSYDSTAWPAYTMKARGRDIWGSRDEFYFLGKYPLQRGTAATISVKVLSIDNTNPWAKAGVMIRENMTPYSKYAGVFITPSQGVTFDWRDATNVDSQSRTKPSDSVGPIRAPVYVRIEKRATNAFVATYSRNGLTWYDVNAPTEGPVNPIITMGTVEDPCIYIGTALSSHNADVTCTASFDLFTLSVTLPTWAFGNIGTNSAEQLYVALEDTTGNISVVEHPDPQAAIQTDWQEWNIELTEFSGVNMDAVKKIYLGLGDRDVPVQGGRGTIYVDDIRACPPRCVPLFGHPAADIAQPYDCVVNEKDLIVLGGDWLMQDRLITTSAPSDVNLTARYQFEGNFNDTSGHGYHATDPCGTTPGFAAGVVGSQALSLDGIDDHLVVGSVGISGAVPRTIAGWAKAKFAASAIADWTPAFGFSSLQLADLNNHSFDIQRRGGQDFYCIHVYGWEENIMPLDQEWHHLAGTYDGTTIRWYGDGVFVGSTARAIDTQDNVQVGKRGHAAGGYWPGLVDEFRIYSVALSEAEIAYLATNGALTLHVPIASDADLYQGEAQGSQFINFKDYAVITGSWLEEILWPTP